LTAIPSTYIIWGMEDYPKNMLEFEDRFANEEACREYLCQMRWPDGFICPKCNHKEFWFIKIGLYRCKRCKFRASVTAGIIFQDARIPLRLWFCAVWQVVTQKHGISTLGLQKILGLKRYETTWILLHKLRTAMVRPGRDRLMGTVEVDETYIGGKHPGKRGRGAEGKSLVIIAVEDKGNRLGRIRLHKVKNASAQSLIPAIKECVEPNSEVRTDGWSGYIGLPSANVGENLLPLTNRVAALLKRWLQGTHQGSPRFYYLDYYLDEFVFRFIRRTSPWRRKLFYRLIQQAVNIEPVKGKHIRGVQH